ncbi:hypothetical protein [Prescottella agglutinans]|nr:hypothetical protein [Prescottella agglutinans]
MGTLIGLRTSRVQRHMGVAMALASGLALTACTDGKAEEAFERRADIPFSQSTSNIGSSENSTTPPIPDAGPISMLEVGNGWVGRVTLDDQRKVQCDSLVPGTVVFEARTSEFSQYDSGSKDPGFDYSVSVVAPENGSGAVTVEFVTADSMHVKASAVADGESTEIRVSDSKDGVAFYAKTSAALLPDGGVTPIVISGTIRC